MDQNLNFNTTSFSSTTKRTMRPTTSKPRPVTGKPQMVKNKLKDKPMDIKNRPYSSMKPSKAPLPKLRPEPLIINTTKSNKNRPMSSSKGNMDFRTIRPASHYQDKCFNKYWESNSVPSTSIIPKILASPKTPDNPLANHNLINNPVFLDNILGGNRLLYKYPQIDWSNKKPASFLTHVGGSEFNLSHCETSFTSRPISAFTSTLSRRKNNAKPNRPFTAMNKTQQQKKLLVSGSQKPARPITALPPSIQEKFEQENKNEYEYDDSFFNDTRNEIKKLYPNVNRLYEEYEKLNVKTYSIKTAQADTDLLEIFDRSQRTLAATLAKVGDYEYYTSFQRIGSFMDYSMQMKWEDLKNIEKHISQTKNNMLCYQSRHNTQPTQKNFTNLSPYFNDPNSMFHGMMMMEPEGEEMRSEINKSHNIYDPIDFLPKYSSDDIFKEELYGEEFIKNVVTSINNYNKYLTTNRIKRSDLKKFNKLALKEKLSAKIYFSFEGQYKNLIETNLSEIEELYYYTLKKIIMDYILRSPHERNRLNIIFFPRKALPSSFTIAEHGSFNRNKFVDWVDNYTNSFNALEKDLSLCNIAVSALIDWTRCFNHVDLVYLKGLDSLKDKELSIIHIDDFCRIEESYMNKAMRFLRDIYYRGAILITKKNKVLKRKDMSSIGRWTFKGFIEEKEEDEDEEYNNPNYGMNYEDQLNDFWTNVNLDDLIDIRLTPSNFGFVTYMLRKQIDLSKNDYDELSAEKKIKLNTSVTSYCSIFFRKLCERALNEFCYFFEKYPSNDALLKEIKENKEKDLDFTRELEYDEHDIKLPQLNSFKISHLVEPIISIRTKYEPLYNLVKLEYNFEQIYEKIIKIIDVVCNLFNSICTTHFLEFKTVLPSEREKIVKEHSSKLNEYFNSDPNQNKSFLDEYYHNLCPNIILEEIETENYMKTYLKIIYQNELFLSDIKSKIYRKVKVEYSEFDECLKIFDPLKDVITNNFSENIKSFLDNYSAIPDYNRYSIFLEKIRTYQKYISIIPDKIQYSMFAIDTRQTKKELNEKLDNDTSFLMRSLEEEIIEKYNQNIEKFSELIKLIDVRLTTPEEVVEMEKTKAKVGSELSEVHHRLEDAYKIYLFLIKIGHKYTDEIISKTVETMKKMKKYQADTERVEKMHQENREWLENKFKDEKNRIEHDIMLYLQEVNFLDEQTHTNEYENVVATIEVLENKVPEFLSRIEKNLRDEELLFDFKSDSFDGFYLGKKKLDKLAILWKNIMDFYEERKALIHNFNEDVDFEYYNTKFADIQNAVSANRMSLRKEEEIVGKMSKILEDDIESISNFLQIVHKVIDSPKPLNEDLKRDVLEILDSKSMDVACREILFKYFSKKT